MYSHVVLAPGGHEDGLLEAREMMALNLRTDTVVLARATLRAAGSAVARG